MRADPFLVSFFPCLPQWGKKFFLNYTGSLASLDLNGAVSTHVHFQKIVQLMWFSYGKEFLHSCVIGYYWLQCCGFGLCRFLPDPKKRMSQGQAFYQNYQQSHQRIQDSDTKVHLFTFKVVYLLKLCPIFVGSVNNFG